MRINYFSAMKNHILMYFVLIFQIPFYPVVKKDFTFIHLGNDSIIEGLINFEKLRMIAKEIRKLSDMCSSNVEVNAGDQSL